MKCKEGKEVELIAELTDQQYDKWLYINNARTTAEQVLYNKEVVNLIEEENMLRHFYENLYLQLAAAASDRLLFLRDIAHLYNVNIDNMCICDKQIYHFINKE